MSSKKQKLLEWMMWKKIFCTHEVQAWGLDNYYTSADRMKRILMEEGKVVKLNDIELYKAGKKDSKEAWYRFVQPKAQDLFAN